MLRDRNLIPLSHQHQHALALCVSVERGLRAAAPEPAHWNAEIASLFDAEIRYHFEAEEKVLFPFAARVASLRDLVDELLVEHRLLRHYAASAANNALTVPDLQLFAGTLSNHVRKEERQLFEGLQQSYSEEELTRTGAALDDYFLHSGMPGATCALRPSKSATDEH